MEKHNEKSHTCQLCNKKYSSIYSFSNHMRIYHDTNMKDNKRTKIDKDDLYHCRYCEKTYPIRNSRCRHEKTCTSKNAAEKNDIVKENENLKEIIRLQKKLLTSNRLTTRTFKAINKILMNNSKQYMINKMNHSQMSNSLNTNSNNTTTHNHIQQIQLE